MCFLFVETPTQMKPLVAPGSQIVYGVEIEAVFNTEYYDITYDINNARIPGTRSYRYTNIENMEDCSLPYGKGREFTFGPVDFRTQKRVWKGWFDVVNGRKIADTRAGMHVHVNRAAFESKVWERVFELVHTNKNLFTFIAGRHSHDFAPFYEQRGGAGYGENGWFRHLESGAKYGAVSQRGRTMEFRLFKSPDTYAEFLLYMECVKAVMIYSKSHKKVTARAFKKYVTSNAKMYPTLFKKVRHFNCNA